MEKMEKAEKSEPPKDTFLTTYILFYALGIVTLVPFNFFTTATDYWMYKFRDPENNGSYNNENRTALQTEFTADYTIVSNKFSTTLRIIFALSGTTGVFLVTCIFVKIDTDSWQLGFLIITLISGSLLTGFCGVFLMTFVETVAKFPPRYMAILFSGQAICGILSAVVQIISLSVGESPSTNGLLYFAVGLVFVALTLLGVILSLKKSRFLRYYFKKEIKPENLSLNVKLILRVFLKIKFYLAALFITTGSSIMIQPAVTSLVLSVDQGNGNRWNDVYFGPVVTFLMYCTFDYIGRELAVFVKKPKNVVIILIAALLRLGFVPLLLFCNVQPREHLAVVFDEDYAYIIFIIIFAFTNGYLMNVSVVHMIILPTEDEKPVCMFFITIFMIVGMAAFSFISIAFIRAL